MALTKTYTKSPCALDSLIQALQQDTAITVALDLPTTSLLGDQLTVGFKADLSDWTEVDTVVAAHTGVPLPQNTVQTVNVGTMPAVTSSDPKDSDGSTLTRTKQTTLGWTFQDHTFEFSAGTYDSLYSKKQDGANFGFATIAFYEGSSGSETLITGDNATDQTYLTTNCTMTVMSWEPTHDYDLMSGELRFYAAVTVDARLWVLAVPDIPSSSGGSKLLLTGRNLRYVKPQDPIVLDGRTVKHLAYNSNYHLNKLRFSLRHPTGFVLAIETCVQLYKA